MKPFGSKYQLIRRLNRKHGLMATIYEGSVACAKSSHSWLEWLEYALQYPNDRHVIIAQTERVAARNVVSLIEDELGAENVKLKQGDGIVEIFGVRVEMVGANNERSLKKIQGATFRSALVDEIALIPRSFYDEFLGRLRAPGGSRYWATLNPEGSNHWFLKELERAALWVKLDGTVEDNTGDPSRLEMMRCTLNLDDNIHLDEGARRRLKNQWSPDSLYYKRKILCQWAAASGAIYTDFSPTRHVITRDQLPQGLEYLCTGIDYGTTNATRGYTLALGDDHLGRGGKSLYVVGEWAPTSGLSDGQYSQSFRQYLDALPEEPIYTYLDPSAASLRRQMDIDGIPGLTPASNAVLPGIRAISALFTADRLFYVDACPLLIKWTPSYEWDPKATERGEDKPLKKDDHEVDALRYSVWSTRHLWGYDVPITMPTNTE